MAKAISEDHKAALEAGRVAGRAVKAYLTYLEADTSKRRRRSEEVIRKDLEGVESDLLDAGPVQKISLLQRRIDLHQELAQQDDLVDVDALEESFVEHVADYSARKGISYQAWREFGVPARVLRRSGLNI